MVCMVQESVGLGQQQATHSTLLIRYIFALNTQKLALTSYIVMCVNHSLFSNLLLAWTNAVAKLRLDTIFFISNVIEIFK